MFGWQISLTGWADNNVIRDRSSALIPRCALIDSFIGLCFAFTHDVDDECSWARLHGDQRVFVYVKVSSITGPGKAAQHIKG